MKSHRRKLTKAQRKIGLRAASAYKTVLLRAALVEIGPIHLLVEELRYLHQMRNGGPLEEVKTEAKQRTLRACQ